MTELVYGVGTAMGRPLGLLGAFGFHDVPCVLSSSLQCGDHCRDVMAVLRESTC